MPRPDRGDVHVDSLLTQVSIGYRNTEYIADDLFPQVPVNKQSDIIPQYDQSHWFRDAAKLRVGGTKSEGGGYTVDNSLTYFCHRYSFRREVEDEVRDNADAPYNLDRDATEFVTDKLQLRREVNFANAYFTNTGVWGVDMVGNTDFTRWSDYGGSTPILDHAEGVDAVEDKIAKEPKIGVYGKKVWTQLRWHPDIIDLIKHTQIGMISQQLLADILGLEKIFIGRAIITTSKDGTPEASVAYQRVWGPNAMLMYVPSRPSLLQPAAGYTFIWNRVSSAIQYIKRMRDEEREVDIIEGNSYFDQKLTGKNGAVFFKDAI